MTAHLTKKTMETHRWLKTDNRLTLYADFDDPERRAAAKECWAWVESLLERVDCYVSLSRDTSDVCRLNEATSGSWTPVKGFVADIVAAALQMTRDTDGMFNPATRWLTDAWGFSPRTWSRDYTPLLPYDRPRDEGGWMAPPDQEDIQALLLTCDVSGVSVERRSGRAGILKDGRSARIGDVVLPLCIDLGGIAKGWVVDQVMSIVHQCGFELAAYSCESSIAMTKSASELATRRGDGRYTLRLARPRPLDGVPDYLQLSLRDRCIATSGDYGRCRERDGVVYSHIINPKTGMPLNVTPEIAYGGERRQSGLCTVTLIGPSATMGDGLATAMCLMGAQGALELYNEKLASNGWDLVAVEYDNSDPNRLGLITSLAPDAFHLTDPTMDVRSERDASGRIRLRR
jgi:thiamine biosynthesis lipoprotein